jgi:hypothetical protein
MKTIDLSATDADLVAQINAAKNELLRRVQERREAEVVLLQSAGITSLKERKTSKPRARKNAVAA